MHSTVVSTWSYHAVAIIVYRALCTALHAQQYLHGATNIRKYFTYILFLFFVEGFSTEEWRYRTVNLGFGTGVKLIFNEKIYSKYMYLISNLSLFNMSNS